jgi:hypothetical protein
MKISVLPPIGQSFFLALGASLVPIPDQPTFNG